MQHRRPSSSLSCGPRNTRTLTVTPTPPLTLTLTLTLTLSLTLTLTLTLTPTRWPSQYQLRYSGGGSGKVQMVLDAAAQSGADVLRADVLLRPLARRGAVPRGGFPYKLYAQRNADLVPPVARLTLTLALTLTVTLTLTLTLTLALTLTRSTRRPSATSCSGPSPHASWRSGSPMRRVNSKLVTTLRTTTRCRPRHHLRAPWSVRCRARCGSSASQWRIKCLCG